MAKKKRESNSTGTQNLKDTEASSKVEKWMKIIGLITGLVVAVAGLLAALNAWGINSTTIFPSPCFYQGATDPITLANLVNAEAEAVNSKNYDIIQKIFDPNARVRNRMNDKDASEKKQEWPSPQAYYADTLFPSTTITGAIHSTITPVGPGITPAEAWLTSASSGYANGVKYDNLPGSDHWRFRKNKDGCWVIAEFDFNASHIQFP